MQEEFNRKFGNFAETPFAREWQKGIGTLEPLNKWFSLMMNKTKHDLSIPRIPQTMTPKEVQETWRICKENKAAPLSGRYNATYKALCSTEYTLQVLTSLMNLPFLSGHAFTRWSNMLDIMAFKTETSIRVETLRSIIIAEPDWNASGRIYITKKMMQQAESNGR